MFLVLPPLYFIGVGELIPNICIIHVFNHNNFLMLLLTENSGACTMEYFFLKKEIKFPYKQIFQFEPMKTIPRYPLTQDKETNEGYF